MYQNVSWQVMPKSTGNGVSKKQMTSNKYSALLSTPVQLGPSVKTNGSYKPKLKEKVTAKVLKKLNAKNVANQREQS